jgi:hypothetical protein
MSIPFHRGIDRFFLLILYIISPRARIVNQQQPKLFPFSLTLAEKGAIIFSVDSCKITGFAAVFVPRRKKADMRECSSGKGEQKKQGNRERKAPLSFRKAAQERNGQSHEPISKKGKIHSI